MLSCSTEKNTLVNRNFHNLNSHYNVYFNGNEAMKMGLEKIETRIEEDYTKILPVFKESLPETEKMVMSDMNIAIEKGIKLIKRHSITSQPEANRKQKNSRKRKPVKPEYNKWVDDAYMMMGQAYLYQKDYIRAVGTFTQIIRKYKDEPVKYEAYLWLARTYSESERYTEARELIESLEGNNQFPKQLEGELAINAADMHLKQQHYDEAIQYLNIGIKKIKGNKRKIRYSFILAQLYEETGNEGKALEAYHQVIRRRPEYQMLFNAQINMAGVFSGEGNASEMRKQLNKMSKKKRNEPFLDQIYFALGNIFYKEGKINDAIELYKKSASVSQNNSHQRALSCLTLSDIFFVQKDYIPAGLYSDSAMVEIDENYPNYKSIAEKHSSLNRLVTNLLMVETQDSLQHLAGLTDLELNDKINGWIAIEAAKIKAEEQEGSESATSEYDQAYGRATSNRMRVNTGSSWYYYNPSTVSYGIKEFERMWGSRKNEDHWRRKNKSISMTDESGEPIDADLSELIPEDTITRVDDKTKAEYYKQDIPNNDSLMVLSHNKIKDALFNAGTIFKTDFNDFERSIDCFKELNRRYPENNYALSSYFNLWDLYKTVDKKDSSEIYRDIILSGFPNSNYSKYLINPNFFIEEEARKDSMNTLYSMVFNAYRNQQFATALNLSKKVEQMNPDSALMPKLKFIQMVSSSKGLNQSNFTEALQDYISQYPNAETSKLAQQVLNLVKEDKLANYDQLINTGYLSEVIKNLELLPNNQNTTEEAAPKWDTDTELLHYFVISIPTDEDIDVNRLKFDIANYNIDHYTSLDFDIETENLNTENRLIVVRNFDQKESALIYFLSIIRKPEVFKTLAGKKFLNFIISSSNFREMLNDRSYNEYLKFFVKNYSSFTSGEFLDEELESPEELMARLKVDDQVTKDQGEFVLITTTDNNTQAPEAKKQLFTLDYSVPHSYLILIKEPRFRTGFLMRDMVKFNTEQYRSNRLRVVPVNLTNATLLLISQFDNAFDANQYLKAATANKSLFSSIGETKYESYIISNQNLDSLKASNNIEEWTNFYKFNYINRKVPEPASPLKEEKTIQQEPVGSIEQTTETPDEVVTKEKTETVVESPTIKKPKEATTPVTQTAEIISDTLSKETTATSEVEATEPEASAESEYKGQFIYDRDAMHNLIYILPGSGSNLTLLTTYLGRFNAMKYRSFGLEVKTETFDEFRSILIVTNLGDQSKAAAYSSEANADSRVSMSLRNVSYKSFLISNENLAKFKTTKDIQDYQMFYSIHY